MKDVLKVFGVDVIKDEVFQKVLLEYEKLMDGNIGEMMLFYIGLLLEFVDKVVNIVDNDLLVILIEFKKVLFLIEFLNKVVDEDI